MKSPARIDLLAGEPRRYPGLVLLAVALAVLAWQGWDAARAVQRLEQERAGLAALAPRRTATEPAMSAEDRRRHAQLEALARYLAAPWADLLAALEERRPGQAVLQRIEQDAASGAIRLTARARHAEAMMAWVQALEADRRLGNVLLHRHEPEAEAAGGALRFELSAQWQGGGDLLRAGSPATAAPAAGARP
ncbi:MAG: hypothetical protein JSR75_21625 [Proteobacteria bacterium]|nr:hypothetical protein [Pseudomonadota bacterium]